MLHKQIVNNNYNWPFGHHNLCGVEMRLGQEKRKAPGKCAWENWGKVNNYELTKYKQSHKATRHPVNAMSSDGVPGREKEREHHTKRRCSMP